jgi:hypothetical protein
LPAAASGVLRLTRRRSLRTPLAANTVDASPPIGASRNPGEIMADPKQKDANTDPHLARALDSYRTTFEASQKTRGSQPPEPPPPAKIIQFPLWPEPVRGMPNPVLRSALFSAIQGKDRRFLNNELIATVDGIQIRFKGEQLNQEDLEICAEVFHLARLHPLGDTCHSAAHALLKKLGQQTGNSQHIQLHNTLLRLQGQK